MTISKPTTKVTMKEPLLIVILCVISSELMRPLEPLFREVREIQRQDSEDIVRLLPENYFK